MFQNQTSRRLWAGAGILLCAFFYSANGSAHSYLNELYAKQLKYTQLTYHYAPHFFHEMDGGKKWEWDFLRKTNFDHDWTYKNNKDNSLRFDLDWSADVYWFVQETETHYFIQFDYFHPNDSKFLLGHENDLEGLMFLVEKDGSEFGKLIAVSTRAHWYTRQHTFSDTKQFFKWKLLNKTQASLKEDFTGRHSFFIEKKGHGMQGPTHLVWDSTHQRFKLKKGQRGVVYSPTLLGPYGMALPQTADMVKLRKKIKSVQHFSFKYELVNYLNPEEGLLYRWGECIFNVLSSEECSTEFGRSKKLGNYGYFPGTLGMATPFWRAWGWGIDPAAHWRKQLKKEYRGKVESNYVNNGILDIISGEPDRQLASSP